MNYKFSAIELFGKVECDECEKISIGIFKFSDIVFLCKEHYLKRQKELKQS